MRGGSAYSSSLTGLNLAVSNCKVPHNTSTLQHQAKPHSNLLQQTYKQLLQSVPLSFPAASRLLAVPPFLTMTMLKKNFQYLVVL